LAARLIEQADECRKEYQIPEYVAADSVDEFATLALLSVVRFLLRDRANFVNQNQPGAGSV
jgi:hypothetical protein